MPHSARILELIHDINVSHELAQRQGLVARASLYWDIRVCLEDCFARSENLPDRPHAAD